ncbi:MAG TPA: hypothetical protein VF791_00380 [Pyrinomonadaceae bacterium]
MDKKKPTPRKTLTHAAQSARDVARVKEIAIGLSCVGCRPEPADLLEMLFIFKKYDQLEQDDMITLVADAIYPLTDEGSSAVRLFLKRAERKAGATK